MLNAYLLNEWYYIYRSFYWNQIKNDKKRKERSAEQQSQQLKVTADKEHPSLIDNRSEKRQMRDQKGIGIRGKISDSKLLPLPWPTWFSV